MKVIVCLAVLDVDGVGGVGQLLVCHRVDAQHPGLLVPQLTATIKNTLYHAGTVLNQFVFAK